MRKFFGLLVFLFSVSFVNGQVLEPASWKVSLTNDQPAKGEEITIVFDVKIDTKWYLYSNDFDPDLGPMITEFVFEPHASYELIGDTEPIHPKVKYDSLWEGEVSVFYEKAQFRQKVRILDPAYVIKGAYEYQVCSDIDGKCILFDDTFRFKSKSSRKSAKDGQKKK